MKKGIIDEIVRLAYLYEGYEEIHGNLGFKDDYFERLMRSVGWEKSQAWCVYYAELVWRQAYENLGFPEFSEELDLIFSGLATQTLINFEKSNKWTVGEEPRSGCLVIWQRWNNGTPDWRGHAGIGLPTNLIDDGYILSMDGNTNDDGSREGYEVARKKRINNYGMSDPFKDGLVAEGFVYPYDPYLTRKLKPKKPSRL